MAVLRTDKHTQQKAWTRRGETEGGLLELACWLAVVCTEGGRASWLLSILRDLRWTPPPGLLHFLPQLAGLACSETSGGPGVRLGSSSMKEASLIEGGFLGHFPGCPSGKQLPWPPLLPSSTSRP
jgi:hypothetical protein